MTTVSLDVLKTDGPDGAGPQGLTIALVGNPNCGKTTLFNILTGLRARTANIAGTTIEQRIGRAEIDWTRPTSSGTCCWPGRSSSWGCRRSWR